MNRFTTISAIFTLALIQLTSHANALTDEIATVTVRYADLNLENTAGAAVLYQRLKQAAAVVCVPPQARDLVVQSHFVRCTQAAVAASIAKVDRPLLTEYYRSVIHSQNAPVLLAKR